MINTELAIEELNLLTKLSLSMDNMSLKPAKNGLILCAKMRVVFTQT